MHASSNLTVHTGRRQHRALGRAQAKPSTINPVTSSGTTPNIISPVSPTSLHHGHLEVHSIKTRKVTAPVEPVLVCERDHFPYTPVLPHTGWLMAKLARGCCCC